MKRILPLILVFILASSNIFAQTLYNLSFLNGTTNTGQFCVDIFMSMDAVGKLGSSNLVFSFDNTNLSNPSVDSHTLSGSYGTPDVRTPADGIASFNVVLNSINNGITVLTTDTKIATVCFDAADLGAVIELNWITSGRNESVVFLDSEAALLAPGTMVNWNGTAFPVEWLSFDAEQQGGDAVLDWSTASEINNNKFEIERSIDGNTFQLIGDTPGKGNTNGISNYSYVDRGAASLGFRTLYYRLRQIDYDGSFEYSPTVELGIAQDKLLSIVGYPNPFQSNLSIRFSSIQRQDLSIEVVNAIGQKMFSKNTSDTDGELNIDTSDWSEGVYYLSINSPTYKEVYKVLKEN